MDSHGRRADRRPCPLPAVPLSTPSRRHRPRVRMDPTGPPSSWRPTGATGTSGCPIHLASRFYDVEQWLADPPRATPRELEALGDPSGLELVHLQCHFGLDTLAWADAGARVTGLDFSPEAIRTAEDLAVRAGLADRSTFVCANVFDAAEVLGPETFDIVYVSLGALHWLPSVDRWADQVARPGPQRRPALPPRDPPGVVGPGRRLPGARPGPTSRSRSPSSTIPTSPTPTPTVRWPTSGPTSGTTGSARW